MNKRLTFDALRRANVARNIAHFGSCSDWTLSDWFMALHGETGEAANIAKKIRRGDFTLEHAREELADELADAQAYLDLLAHAAGIDPGEATRAKFNRVSLRIGYTKIAL